MILLFSFSLNPESNEAAFAGNIGLQQALQILQSLVIADAVNKAREAMTGQNETNGATIGDAPDVSKSREGG